MKATRGVDAIEDWIAFLMQQKPYDYKIRAAELESSQKRLATLKALLQPTTP
jgi:hypothetical protein